MKLLASMALMAMAAAAAHGQEATDAKRIARVERGLLPPYVTERTKPMLLSDRLRHYKVPAVSVAVVDNGKLVWAKAWGQAQVGQGQPVTTKTLFQAASISKPVTALGAFRLIDAGKLTLDGDVNAVLRSWQVPAGAQTADKPVTLRGLLSHTAGLTVSGFAGYKSGTSVPTLVQILDGVPPANSPPVRVAKQPGGEFSYSGGGYVLLQRLMEDVTGQPFAEWMQHEVLSPAGMGDSLFGALPDAPLSRAAAGHQEGKATPGLRATHPELAAAGLWTTPTDLAKLSMALQRTLAGEAGGLVPPALFKQAVTAAPGAMGLGFVVEGTLKDPLYGHDGSNAGFESRWRFDRQRAVIVMANANGARPLMEEIIRAVAAAHGWADLPARPVPLQQLREAFAAAPIYLRGSLNEWGLTLPMRRAAAGRRVAEVDLPMGTISFKFGSEDWRAVDLGSGTTGGGSLGTAGPNLSFDAEKAGRYRIELDVRDAAAPRYSVRLLKVAARGRG